MNMKNSDMATAFRSLHLKETVLDWHGFNGPSTFRRNRQGSAIDGIWMSSGLATAQCGYLADDALVPSTEHRCIWLDITYITVFGHNDPATDRPKTRRLHCRDPRLVENYLRLYISMEKNTIYWIELTNWNPKLHILYQLNLQYELETIDAIWCEISAYAEKHCRKLRKGQVGFSPAVQKAIRGISLLLLLKNRKQGLRVSSRL